MRAASHTASTTPERRSKESADGPMRCSARCPQCGYDSLLRSHTRLFERWRKWFKATRPHRCRACGWRGWL